MSMSGYKDLEIPREGSGALGEELLEILNATRANFLGSVLRKRGVVVVYGVSMSVQEWDLRALSALFEWETHKGAPCSQRA